MKLILRRETRQPSHTCTLGLLLCPEAKGLSLVTIERPWIPSTPENRGGLKGKSCVPVGTYKLVRHVSKKHGHTWALVNHELDVVHYEGDDRDSDEDRSTCLLHAANFAHQLEGCIAPGTHTAKAPNGEYMVASSQKAMQILREKVPWVDGHTLEIIQA